MGGSHDDSSCVKTRVYIQIKQPEEAMFYFDEETISIISCEVVLITKTFFLKTKTIFLKRRKKTHSECVLANTLPD